MYLERRKPRPCLLCDCSLGDKSKWPIFGGGGDFWQPCIRDVKACIFFLLCFFHADLSPAIYLDCSILFPWDVFLGPSQCYFVGRWSVLLSPMLLKHLIGHWVNFPKSQFGQSNLHGRLKSCISTTECTALVVLYPSPIVKCRRKEDKCKFRTILSLLHCNLAARQ